MARRSVVLLTTGGTLSTASDPVTGRSQPSLDANAVAALARVPGIGLSVREITRVASWALDPAAMLGIATAARDAARDPGVAGVVVTHGTSTLEYTAFLTDLLLDDGAPVVFTGAMRPADDADPDGPRNLRDALRVAASPDARGLGCLVVLAGRVMAGGSVWKARRTDPDAFVDLAGDVGTVSARTVRIARRPVRRPALRGVLATEVALVKAVPGASGWLIDAAMRSRVRGLVVEGLPGMGGIPPLMQPALEAAARRVPVVIASRAPYGRLPSEPTGGTGEPLLGAGLLSAGTLTAEQAFVLLMAVLGEHADPNEARSAFMAANVDRTEGAASAASASAASKEGRRR